MIKQTNGPPKRVTLRTHFSTHTREGQIADRIAGEPGLRRLRRNSTSTLAIRRNRQCRHNEPEARGCQPTPVAGHRSRSAGHGRDALRFRRDAVGRPVHWRAHDAITDPVRLVRRRRDYRVPGKGRCVWVAKARRAGDGAERIKCVVVRTAGARVCRIASGPNLSGRPEYRALQLGLIESGIRRTWRSMF